jgi:uncharacterized protein YndB with AHSA1/START domain
MTEKLTVDEQGRTVLRMERRLAHPPAKVWRALTEPAELSRWYPFTATDIELRVGGAIRFDLSSDPHLNLDAVMEGVVTEVDPPRVFAFSEPAGDVLEREGDNLLRFELYPDPDGCLLVFTHVFHDRPGAAANAAGWAVCLDAMDAALAGRPAAQADFVALHEAYLHQFGLAGGSTEDTPEGWRIRFERQLMMQPVEQAWARLANTAPVVGDPPPAPFTLQDGLAGPVTVVEAPRLLEYEWRGGTVRWELASHPAGARVTLTQTGPATLDRERALSAWQDRLDQLAGAVRSSGAA